VFPPSTPSDEWRKDGWWLAVIIKLVFSVCQATRLFSVWGVLGRAARIIPPCPVTGHI